MEALGINGPGLITSIVSFVLLFAVLYFLLYKPLLRVMDDRSAKIRESLDTAQMAREEAQRSREDMQKQIDEARAEGQVMIAQAREVAERFREEELAKARQEIEAQRAACGGGDPAGEDRGDRGDQGSVRGACDHGGRAGGPGVGGRGGTQQVDRAGPRGERGHSWPLIEGRSESGFTGFGDFQDCRFGPLLARRYGDRRRHMHEER